MPIKVMQSAVGDVGEQGPQMAINGFIAWLLFIAMTAVYVIWAVIPDEVLHHLQITYYPDRYWTVALPAILVMIFYYYFTTSILLVLITTHPLDDGRVVTDVDSKADTQVNLRAFSEATSSVPPWVDIPVSVTKTYLKTGAPMKVTAVRRVSGLERLITAVGARSVEFTGDDLFRICALMKSPQDDVLGLRGQADFMKGLSWHYHSLAEVPIPPFQKTLIEFVLPLQSSSPSVSVDAAGNVGPLSTLQERPPDHVGAAAGLPEPTVKERIAAMWEVVGDSRESGTCGPDQMQQLDAHLAALQTRLRELTPVEVAQLVKALAAVHYQNYQYTELLARRGCEVAAQLPRPELCRLYYNLVKLNTCDSLTAVVNRLLTCTSELTSPEVLLLAQSLERQANTSSSSARLVTAVVTQGTCHVGKAKSLMYHRALLVIMARYGLQRGDVAAAILKDGERFMAEAHEHDLVAILEVVGALGIPDSSECYAPLLTHLESVVPKVSAWTLSPLLDALSVLPTDTTAVMLALMSTLETTAGQLPVAHLASVLDILSTYPPACGHVCIVSLGFAAAVRSAGMDSATLESIVVSLAVLRHFTDDFYTIMGVLTREKGGVHRLETIEALVTHGDGRDSQVVKALQEAVGSYVVLCGKPELDKCQEFLRRAGVCDRVVIEKVQARRARLQHGCGPQSHPTGRRRQHRKPYDPMGDLL